MTAAPVVSVVIVSYRCRGPLEACLESLAALEDSPLEVIVVDNASGDGAAEELPSRFPEVRWIANKRNRGFAAACNQGLLLSRGEYLWLLNPDTEIPAGSLTALIAALDASPDCGMVGGRLVNSEGKFQEACRRLAPTPRRALEHFFMPLGRQAAGVGYELRHLDRESTHPVEALSGACMLMKRETLRRVGFLDEGFFFMGEDLDYCRRVRAAGFEIVYVGSAPMLHHHGASRRKVPWRVTYERHRAMARYYGKHLAEGNPWPLRLLVYAGIVLRGAAMGAVNLVRNVEESK